MITLSRVVKGLLEGLGVPVYYFHPQSWLRLPAISWRESGSRELAQADGREHLAELTYAVDIWSASPAENQELAARLDAFMFAARFRRDYAADLFDTTTGLHHRSARYRAVADADGNIYQ